MTAVLATAHTAMQNLPFLPHLVGGVTQWLGRR